MGPFWTALLFSVGAATWIYTKLSARSGYGNTKNALIGAAIAGLLLFIVVYSIARMVL